MNYPHIAQLLFNRPLLINERRLQVILDALMPYFDGQVPLKRGLAHQEMEAVEFDHDTRIETVAVVPVLGTLVHRSYGGLEAMSGGPTSYFEIRAHIERATRDPDVKGIILDLASGGGEGNGVFDLADYIRVVSQEKPVMAIVDETAFSAAYAIASGASSIVVPKTGGVGSIGVLALHVDQSAFDKKQGVRFTFIHAGKLKVEGNPHEPLTSEGKQRIQEEVNMFYDLFVSGVAARRGLSEASIRATEAGIFFGADAVERGLADIVASRSEAIGMFMDLVTHSPVIPVGSLFTERLKEGYMTKVEEKPTDKKAEESTPVDVVLDRPPGRIELLTDEQMQAAFDARVAAHQAYCDHILEVCQLAGNMGLAKEFIAKRTGVDEVRKALLQQRLDADAALQVVGHHDGVSPESSRKPVVTEHINAVYDRYETQMGVRK